MRSCQRVELTKVVTLEGAGVPGDPAREVTWYFDDAGELLWKHDCIEQDRIKAALGEPLL